jgi:hypothetical protein
MSPRGGNDALCGIDELPALEHTEVLEASRDLIFRCTGERLCNFGTGQTVRFPIVQWWYRKGQSAGHAPTSSLVASSTLAKHMIFWSKAQARVFIILA